MGCFSRRNCGVPFFPEWEKEYEIYGTGRKHDACAKRALLYRNRPRELAEKELTGLDLPMIRDREILEKKRREAADVLASLADGAARAAVLTLGDPSIYCSISYLQPYLAARGVILHYVSGVPSFCAAAAAWRAPLALEDEELRILPGLYEKELPEFNGTYVLMKSGRNYRELRESLEGGDRELYLAENCGLPGEKLVCPPEELPEEAGYLSVLMARKRGGLSG